MEAMFRGATAFNQPLSFDTAKVDYMTEMFNGATAFNQDLCHFGDNFSQPIDVEGMFQNSGCSNKNVPTSASGPWCACRRSNLRIPKILRCDKKLAEGIVYLERDGP
ncbi:hypothetical protein THAOC_29819 [Thalassiosira oceanica]|uniref:BspA family leucine-rich repeat surface protein n=1 Tax=Thalassiosira oceanica TaxID=159749 RepID=K0RWA8_THAOC|nr:hypothetical protein THAOC_29819 [Thalassiosira oceanica]|eukprot:EJK51047.1 hypothetical protein THAOC_29819 [Thalassiosira oceanica]